MIRCPSCGFANLTEAPTCTRCAGPLLGRIDLGPARRRWNGARNAATIALRPAMLLRWRIQSLLDSPPPAALAYRNPWFAAWLSLVPGLGQWFNGQRKLGAATFALFAALVAVGVWAIVSPLSDLLFLAALFVMLYAMNHALLTAQQINGGIGIGLGMRRWAGFFVMLGATALVLWGIQYIGAIWACAAALLAGTAALLATIAGRRARAQGGYVSLLLLLLLWGAFGYGAWRSPTWLWHSIIRLQSQGQTRFEPFIARGDRLLIETISQSWRGIQLGDIVLYDPPGYSIEIEREVSRGSDKVTLRDLHAVNMPLNIERVIGLPGDVVERREGVFHRNGAPVPPLHQPLIQDEMPRDYRIEVPAGHYAIMISYTPVEWMPGYRGFYGSRPRQASRLDAADLNGTVIVVGWDTASIIPARDVFGRVLMTYYPWARRRWLDGRLPGVLDAHTPPGIVMMRPEPPAGAPPMDGAAP